MRCTWLLVLLVWGHVLGAEVHTFDEVWTYVYRKEEHGLRTGLPITDVAYFSAVVNETGRIPNSVDPQPLRQRLPKKTRIHLVVSAPFNRSLMYWCLHKDRETRDALIQDIVRVSSGYEGVQVDFESIRPQDGEAYASFLRDLRKQLPADRMLSVALPARVREMQDGYPYKEIGQIADRVVVMAYDEHYRTSKPGSIASLDWCARVSAFARQEIPRERLVMGLPVYGRVWQSQTVAKALKYTQLLDLWKEHRSTIKRDADTTPYFTFQTQVDATVYYEDEKSIAKKLELYEEQGVRGVALWRLTQEPAAMWQRLSVQ